MSNWTSLAESEMRDSTSHVRMRNVPFFPSLPALSLFPFFLCFFSFSSSSEEDAIIFRSISFRDGKHGTLNEANERDSDEKAGFGEQ